MKVKNVIRYEKNGWIYLSLKGSPSALGYAHGFLVAKELKEIFKIILSNNEKYSNKKNGIFINLNTLKKSTIQAISDFLYFSDNNKTLDELEEYERSKYKEILINN